MAGLAGLGDLVLTCTGGLSRNRSVGIELGRGRKLDDIIAGMHGMVAEGVLTTNAAVGLARRAGVEMPITEQMHAILQQGKSVQEAIRDLMRRPSTSEVGSYQNGRAAQRLSYSGDQPEGWLYPVAPSFSSRPSSRSGYQRNSP